MISRRVDVNNPREVAYAVNKGYDWKDDRTAARLSDYPDGVPPAEWGPLLEEDPPLFWSYPQKFLGPMLITRNRHGINQHRMECRVCSVAVAPDMNNTHAAKMFLPLYGDCNRCIFTVTLTVIH